MPVSYSLVVTSRQIEHRILLSALILASSRSSLQLTDVLRRSGRFIFTCQMLQLVISQPVPHNDVQLVCSSPRALALIESRCHHCSKPKTLGWNVYVRLVIAKGGRLYW